MLQNDKTILKFGEYNEAFAAAMEAGGKRFLLDIFSADVAPPPVPAEKPFVTEQLRAAR